MNTWGFSPELLAAMRNWARIDGIGTAEMDDDQVVALIGSSYAGGVEQFRRDWRVWRPTGSTPRPLTVTVCGSMRFFPHMVQVATDETVAGRIVLLPFVVIRPDRQLDNRVKAELDVLHRHKIDAADHILVVTDHTGYIGESTRGEIEYAAARGKWAGESHMRRVELPYRRSPN